MRVQLIIKGNRVQAGHALLSRSIDDFKIINETQAETTVYAQVNMEIIHGWFSEDNGRVAPFPIGSLLHFGACVSPIGFAEGSQCKACTWR
jgi:hypothetical protein